MAAVFSHLVKGSISFTAGQASVTATVASYDRTKAWVEVTLRQAVNSVNFSTNGVVMTRPSDTQLVFSRHGGETNQTITVEYTIHVFSSGCRVQDVEWTTDGQKAIDAVDLDSSFVVPGGVAHNITGRPGNMSARYSFLDEDTLLTEGGVSTFSVGAMCQVVELEDSTVQYVEGTVSGTSYSFGLSPSVTPSQSRVYASGYYQDSSVQNRYVFNAQLESDGSAVSGTCGLDPSGDWDLGAFVVAWDGWSVQRGVTQQIITTTQTNVSITPVDDIDRSTAYVVSCTPWFGYCSNSISGTAAGAINYTTILTAVNNLLVRRQGTLTGTRNVSWEVVEYPADDEPQLIASGFGAETDAGVAQTLAKVLPQGVAVETDSAHGAALTKVIAAGFAVDVSAAVGGVLRKVLASGFASEADAGISATLRKILGTGFGQETDSAFAGAFGPVLFVRAPADNTVVGARRQRTIIGEPRDRVVKGARRLRTAN